MNIEGAIFDLDGTLLDSMPVWDTLAEDYIQSIGKNPKAGLREKVSDMSLVQAANYFISEYGVSASQEEILNQFNEMLSDFYIKKAKVKKGVKEFLGRLKNRNVKMCVVTATEKILAEKALKNNGMEEYFQYIFTCTEMGYGKDSVEIFNEALNALDTCKDKTYVFEDALYAVETAKKAGMKVVAVFDKSSAEKKQQIEGKADIYINSFLEMEDYFD